MIQDLIRKTRSYRRFKEANAVSPEALTGLVGLARLAPSGGNIQPLRFVPVADKETRELVFATLKWAARLRDWPGPAPGERPAAYIIIVLDTEVSASCGQDTGLAAYSMLLGAAEKGLGGCMIGSIDRNQLRSVLRLPERYEIQLVVALGEPAETVVIDEAGEADTAYWRDDKDRHHVPKLPLDSLILKI